MCLLVPFTITAWVKFEMPALAGVSQREPILSNKATARRRQCPGGDPVGGVESMSVPYEQPLVVPQLVQT